MQCGAAASQSSLPEIIVAEPYALPAIAEGNGVIYLKLVNEGGRADTLLKVESQVAEAAEMHETKIDENDVMRMRPLAHLEIPAGESVSLEPGGKHIMLIKLKQALKSGEKINLTLTFAKSGSLNVVANVHEASSTTEHLMEHSPSY
jgi:copper(I)-binding protein